jgi:hypothetical protein
MSLSMTESETVTESMRRISSPSRIIYLPSRIFSRGLKWAADWQTGVKPGLPLISRD